MVADRVARNTGRSAAFAAVLLFAMIQPAAAYLDPGTGSMVLQGLIGAVVGGLVAIRIYWGKIKLFFGAKAGGGTSELDAAKKQNDESRPT